MAGMHKAVSERHGMTTIAALVAIVAMIFASVIAAPQRAYAEEYNISDLGWVDKDDTSFEISSDGGKTWKPYISGMQVNYGDQIRTELHWKVPNDVKINEGDTFVYDLPGNLEYKSNEKYPIYNGGDVVGYYTIDGDKMVATYTRGESAGSNIEAFVTTDGTITSNKTGGSAGGDTSFTFPGYGTITVNVEGKHSVNVVKRPAISTSDASTYDFVLEVTSTGTNTGVTIDDTMGGLLTFVDGSVHIYTDADCKNEYTGAWQSSKTDDHNFNVTIGSMGDGEKLYVRYSVNANKEKRHQGMPRGRQLQQCHRKQKQGDLFQQRRRQQEGNQQLHLVQLQRLVCEQKRNRSKKTKMARKASLGTSPSALAKANPSTEPPSKICSTRTTSRNRPEIVLELLQQRRLEIRVSDRLARRIYGRRPVQSAALHQT